MYFGRKVVVFSLNIDDNCVSPQVVFVQFLSLSRTVLHRCAGEIDFTAIEILFSGLSQKSTSEEENVSYVQAAEEVLKIQLILAADGHV